MQVKEFLFLLDNVLHRNITCYIGYVDGHIILYSSKIAKQQQQQQQQKTQIFTGFTSHFLSNNLTATINIACFHSSCLLRARARSLALSTFCHRSYHLHYGIYMCIGRAFIGILYWLRLVLFRRNIQRISVKLYASYWMHMQFLLLLLKYLSLFHSHTRSFGHALSRSLTRSLARSLRKVLLYQIHMHVKSHYKNE